MQRDTHVPQSHLPHSSRSRRPSHPFSLQNQVPGIRMEKWGKADVSQGCPNIPVPTRLANWITWRWSSGKTWLPRGTPAPWLHATKSAQVLWGWKACEAALAGPSPSWGCTLLVQARAPPYRPSFGGVLAPRAACAASTPGTRGVLNGEKKNVPVPVFPKKPAGTPCAQPWLVAVGGWRLAAVGGWQLVVGGGWQWLAVGGWSPLAVGGWRLVAVGGWRLVAVGS